MNTTLQERPSDDDIVTPAFDRLVPDALHCLSGIPVLARRLVLDTPGVAAHVPMLRGVWGAALHATAPETYQAVFAGDAGPDGGRIPGYVLRPAPADPIESPAVEWLLFGNAVRHDAPACRAWEEALQKGLGRARRPARIRASRVLLPTAAAAEEAMAASGQGVWTLDHARWPVAGDPPITPCRIVFDAPLRVLRRGSLVSDPALADIIVALCRRITALTPPDRRRRASALGRTALCLAKAVPAGRWHGSRHDLVRYSGSQKAEVDMHGVSGSLDLPAGPGSLWPLLAAGQWLHAGKGTVFGLGQIRIEPLPPARQAP